MDTRKKEDINIFRKFMFAELKLFLTNQIEQLKTNQKLKKTNDKGLSFLF